MTPARCAGKRFEKAGWPRRPEPCPSPVAYVVQDSDELRPMEHACKLHLGGLVSRMVAHYGAVTVEAVK